MRKYSSFTPRRYSDPEENPNTSAVTASRLSDYLEAKKVILELHQAGWTARRIVEELGNMILRCSVRAAHEGNMVRNVRREAESKNGLHEGYLRTAGTRMSEEEIEDSSECNPGSYAKLKNEVIYLREEVEFLKKVSQQVISGKRGK